MLLSKETIIQVSDEYSNILSHMNYAASKLWNVCNYERRNYKTLGLQNFPDWYYQKSYHKDNVWFKALPSQTAQEVCKLLDKSWKSYFALLKSKGIENPKPPRFKQNGIAITYMQNAIKRMDDNTLRLTLSKGLKSHMSNTYGIHEDYLYLKNNLFKDMEAVKLLRIYPPKDNKVRVIAIYEVADRTFLPDNGKYLSIDLGVKNPLTCYDSATGTSFIVGREYKSICHKYDKMIAHYQSICELQQASAGVKYPKPSKRILSLYEKKRRCIKDYFHKCTRYIVSYCKANDIHTVVIGDITHIRDGKDFGDAANQTFHALPYKQIYGMLEYKLALEGIRLVSIKEAYSSQCSPLSETVSRKFAKKINRKHRGLYVEKNHIWNADSVGSFNILRLYFGKENRIINFTPTHLSNPLKVAV